MPSHYNLRAFLQQLSPDHVIALFEHHGIDPGLCGKTRKAREIESMVAAINALPEDRRLSFDQDGRAIQSLATRAGLKHILAEAQYRQLAIVEELQRPRTILNKVAWTRFRHGEVFAGASRLAVRDILPGRYWKRRLPLTARPGADLSIAERPLEAAISHYFTTEEGRGKACKVEYFRRGSLHHFFAYPEDYPASPLAWTAQGLGPHVYRPALEIVFVFDDAAGWLDIYFEGDKEGIERLRGVFAKTVLAIRDLPDLSRPVYSLDALKARDFQFVRPPDSVIADLRLKRLGFLVLGKSVKISVEADPTFDPFALHNEIEQIFSPVPAVLGWYTLAQTKVISATIAATIDLHDGARPRRRTFDITERACALKHEGHDLLLRQMLIDSGIDLSANPGLRDGEPTRPAA